MNHGRHFLKGFCNWDKVRVFEVLHKPYIQEIIAKLNPYIEPGAPGYLPLWRKAVAAGLDKMSSAQMRELEEKRDLWNRSGPPPDVQRR